jgi:hypothetical protein
MIENSVIIFDIDNLFTFVLRSIRFGVYFKKLRVHDNIHSVLVCVNDKKEFMYEY